MSPLFVLVLLLGTILLLSSFCVYVFRVFSQFIVFCSLADLNAFGYMTSLSFMVFGKQQSPFFRLVCMDCNTFLSSVCLFIVLNSMGAFLLSAGTKGSLLILSFILKHLVLVYPSQYPR